jgi:predicted deacylase
MTIQSVTFHALEKGAHLVVFGAVHGNEKCGTVAIRRAIAELQSGALTLARGCVTFVPVCNPRAYGAGVRFTERNLNRHFYPKDKAEYYEDTLDPILCGILDDADVLLDLHSYQSEGDAFCFLGTKSQAEIDYGRALGVETYIYGWADAFSKDATEEQRLASLGTTDYARAKANPALAVTLECGSHDDPRAPEMGYQGIVRALTHLGLIDAALPPIAHANQRAVRMHSVFYKAKAGAFTQPWKHGQRVKAGELIARYDDGDTITAPEDGVLVLPKSAPDFAIGAEWCYFGVETAFLTISIP